MSTHGSATLREETPHANETNTTIGEAVRRRAWSIIDDTSIDSRWRVLIRYGLQTNDPLLPDLVQRVDAGEEIVNTIDFSLTRGPSQALERNDEKP